MLMLCCSIVNRLGLLAKANVDAHSHELSPDSSSAGGPPISTPPVARQLSFASLPAAPVDEPSAAPSVREVVEGLTKSATKKRIARLMQKKQDGTFKVPEELVKEWNGGNQDKLMEEFINAGMDKEASFRII